MMVNAGSPRILIAGNCDKKMRTPCVAAFNAADKSLPAPLRPFCTRDKRRHRQ